MVKHYEIQLRVDGFGRPFNFISHTRPAFNEHGFLEIALSDGVQMFNRSRISQMSLVTVTEEPGKPCQS